MKVLVTGASRGIGAAVATLLARRGDEVWMVAREPDGLATAAAALAVPRERTIAVDLTSPDAHARILAALGGTTLDSFIGVAGIATSQRLGEIDAATLRTQLETNLVAPILLTQALAPHLADGGAITHVTSNLAQRPVPGRLAYAASKAALESAVRSLALELSPRTIRVNAVALGLVRTDMVATLPLDSIAAHYPLGIGSVEDAARAVVAITDLPWTTGSTFTIDGGAAIDTPR